MVTNFIASLLDGLDELLYFFVVVVDGFEGVFVIVPLRP
jgi:hypothetical protein